jgi:hypothetical protein
MARLVRRGKVGELLLNGDTRVDAALAEFGEVLKGQGQFKRR